MRNSHRMGTKYYATEMCARCYTLNQKIGIKKNSNIFYVVCQCNNDAWSNISLDDAVEIWNSKQILTKNLS